jgi:hypothetical protein
VPVGRNSDCWPPGQGRPARPGPGWLGSTGNVEGRCLQQGWVWAGTCHCGPERSITDSIWTPGQYGPRRSITVTVTHSGYGPPGRLGRVAAGSRPFQPFVSSCCRSVGRHTEAQLLMKAGKCHNVTPLILTGKCNGPGRSRHTGPPEARFSSVFRTRKSAVQCNKIITEIESQWQGKLSQRGIS